MILAGFADLKLEILGIGEERRRPTGVQKDNDLIFTDSFSLDVIDEAGHRLARVDRIKDDPFGLGHQFHRLAGDLIKAVEAGGFEPTGHCSPLTCLENRVYDLRLEGGQHVVVKFYRPGRCSREAILDEHRYLAQLREAEVAAAS